MKIMHLYNELSKNYCNFLWKYAINCNLTFIARLKHDQTHCGFNPYFQIYVDSIAVAFTIHVYTYIEMEC